ncbi:MAG: hypothetical protein KGV50_03635 [Gammaproteobacteria bacterium]|nr:hypothetical protein [Gammaproteobacteria bacterium]
MDIELIVHMLLGICFICLPAFFLRRQCFFRHIVLNFLAFLFILHIIDNYGYKLVWYWPEIDGRIQYFIRQIFPIIYAPVYCYFLTDYEKPNSNLKKLFNIISVLIILFIFYEINTINLIYPYFIVSVVTFFLFRDKNYIKKALLSSTIAIGFHCMLSLYHPNYALILFNSFGGSMSAFLEINFNLLNYQFSMFEILFYLIYVIFIILGIFSIKKFYKNHNDNQVV